MQNHPSVELLISARDRDLGGGLTVRRILPYATHRMVGPFIFFDHMGPARFAPGQGISVRPHPHVNLSTVTYLFEGKIIHRDSLGFLQAIEPGAINWMTAGRGIVHSERAPKEMLEHGGTMNGIQCWVALPESAEEVEPSFHHHPASTLPEFQEGSVWLKLLLGRAYGRQSPVHVHSDLFYLEARMAAESQLQVPAEGRESAVYVVDGQVSVDGVEVGPQTMAVAKGTATMNVSAQRESRLMLLGGPPVGPRHIYWNFVSSSKERLEAAKADWAKGPREGSSRFRPIPGDDREHIPLPD